jgi:uncharacterized protein YegP (UPF0339 family)
MAAKFEIFTGSNSQYYFRLKAANGEKILASEGYTTKQNCKNGIESVKASAPYDSNYARLVSRNGQYYFNLKSSNGQVVGVSETYTTVVSRDHGVEAVKVCAPTAATYDLS